LSRSAAEIKAAESGTSTRLIEHALTNEVARLKGNRIVRAHTQRGVAVFFLSDS
jgi:hypothetical protein